MGRGMSGAVHTPPRCEGMAQNCAHYAGGCSQCRPVQSVRLSVEKGRDYYGLYYIEGAPFRISFWTHGTDLGSVEGARRLEFARALADVWNTRTASEPASGAEIARMRRALSNIKALVIKAQAYEANGTLAHIEGFARAGLGEGGAA